MDGDPEAHSTFHKPLDFLLQSHDWNQQPKHQMISRALKNLYQINDSSERALGLVTQLISKIRIKTASRTARRTASRTASRNSHKW